MKKIILAFGHNPRRAIILIILALPLVISACAARGPKVPKVTPTQVVERYLIALEKGVLGEAYETITLQYAQNKSKETWVQKQQESMDKLGYQIVYYKILGENLGGTEAWVVAETGVKYKPPDLNEEVKQRVKTQYLLSIVDGAWKIYSHNELENEAVEEF